jgi:hypothetical protein
MGDGRCRMLAMGEWGREEGRVSVKKRRSGGVVWRIRRGRLALETGGCVR